jgi:hypothetical protein
MRLSAAQTRALKGPRSMGRDLGEVDRKRLSQLSVSTVK